MKQFTSIHDVENIELLIQKAIQFKKNPLSEIELGKNKTLGLIFMNPSLRTRISTQKAAQHLGLNVITMNADKDGWALEFTDGFVMNGNTVEHIKDAAAVMGEYFDILAVRNFPSLNDRDLDYSEHVMQQFIKYYKKPFVSLESATRHPLQSFADCITIEELKNKTNPKVVLTWAPHIKPIPQPVANSFAEWMNHSNVDFTITHPKGYELEESFSGKASINYNQNEALENADFVYVKNWSSYNKYGKVLNSDENWMLTKKHLELTNNAKVMHCLPVRRNVELSDEILDSSNSVVLQQAQNRIWAAQTVLSEILKSN